MHLRHLRCKLDLQVPEFATCALLRTAWSLLCLKMLAPTFMVVFIPIGPKQPPPSFDWTGSLHIAAALQEWHRFDAGSPWMAAGARPGPSPFKSEGSVFDVVLGADLPSRIYPDVVHTFHIGFGCDLAASIICWLARLNIFGNGKFDEKLRKAYSDFQAFCHDTNRFTACDEWSTKKLGMKQILVKIGNILDVFWVSYPMAWAMWKKTFPAHLRTNDFPTSLGGKGHDTGVVCRWLQSVLCGLDPCQHSSQGSCGVDTCCWETWVWQAEDCNTQILEIMRYTICQCNAFFDILYSHGVFLPESDSAAAKRAAIDMCETWLCFHKGLNHDNLVIFSYSSS